ncbi:MAG: glycoside hydrolase family 2 TIM barrel-domain containing protein [Bryobacteraceae bacterium]
MKPYLSRRALVAGVLPLARTLAATADSDGMLRIDEKRTFVHGLYHTPKSSDGLRSAAAAGFQVIHAPAQRAYLDDARTAGLSCWLTASSDPARIRKIVAEFGSHPAVLFWETEDEPSYQWKKPGPRVTPEKIRAAYALLKQLDPQRPVYLNHAPTNLVSTLREYNPGGDILATDIYPVIPHGIRELYALWPTGRQGDFSDTHISQVGRYADKIRKVAGPSRATFMVLQAFAWENLREKDRDPAMVVYPTRDQLRFMAWQSVVHGVNGILWWGLSHTPGDAPLWQDLVAVVKEMKAHEAALAAKPQELAPTFTYHDTGHSLDRGLEWIAKPAPDGTLFVAVNADPNPVDVTIGGLLSGTLRVHLAPFEVRLLLRQL